MDLGETVTAQKVLLVTCYIHQTCIFA